MRPGPVNRRTFLATAMGAAFAMTFPPHVAGARPASFAPDHPLQDSWQSWKALCLAPDGRVIDGFQDDASHSEGQGYGLTLAALFGDEAAAAQIIRWTETNLAIREDALLAWRWRPDVTPHVTDRNNASDGDLFYAWGLSLAAPLGDSKARLARAAAIARDLVKRCSAPWPDGSGRLVLLPGTSGFRRDEGIILNPSYYMARALRDLSTLASEPDLARLATDGDALIATLAARGPVPDWVMLTASDLAPAPEPFSGVSGYEALRVPLFALWSDQAESPALRAYAKRMAAAGDLGGVATVFDTAGPGVFERSAHPGYAALAALADCVTSGEVGSVMPGFTADQPYYPATLHLMALVAQASSFQRCVPI